MTILVYHKVGIDLLWSLIYILASLYLAIQLARALDVTAEWALQKYYRYIKSRAQTAAAVFLLPRLLCFGCCCCGSRPHRQTCL